MNHKAISKEAIEKALRACDWNRRHASAVLGISPDTLYVKVKQYGIVMPDPKYCWAKPQRLDFVE